LSILLFKYFSALFYKGLEVASEALLRENSKGGGLESKTNRANTHDLQRDKHIGEITNQRSHQRDKQIARQ
jgi:hypothetical protein